MGARPMARVIQEHIKRPLAEELLFGKLAGGGTVKIGVSADGKELALTTLPTETPALPATFAMVSADLGVDADQLPVEGFVQVADAGET